MTCSFSLTSTQRHLLVVFVSVVSLLSLIWCTLLMVYFPILDSLNSKVFILSLALCVTHTLTLLFVDVDLRVTVGIERVAQIITDSAEQLRQLRFLSLKRFDIDIDTLTRCEPDHD